MLHALGMLESVGITGGGMRQQDFSSPDKTLTTMTRVMTTIAAVPTAAAEIL
jgi:hypothetical protein